VIAESIDSPPLDEFAEVSWAVYGSHTQTREEDAHFCVIVDHSVMYAII